MLQVAVARKSLFQIVADVSHAMLKLVHLVFDLLKPAKCREGGFVYSRPGLEVNVLGQQTEL